MIRKRVVDWNGDGIGDIELRRISTGMFYFRTKTATGWSQTSAGWDSRAG